MMKKIIVILMIFCMAVTMMPSFSLSAFAEDMHAAAEEQTGQS